jgi:hypothetical protein
LAEEGQALLEPIVSARLPGLVQARQSQAVFVPAALREPPLTLRITTSGRMARSARLLSALSPLISTNWNSSSSCRSNRFASA